MVGFIFIFGGCSAADDQCRISFSITLVPNSAICVANLILIRVIDENVFEGEYKSIEEILERSNLETVDCVSLPWKESAKEKVAFPMDSTLFYRLWTLVFLALGARVIPRPYSLRMDAATEYNSRFNYTLFHLPLKLQSLTAIQVFSPRL